ncbi:MAG: hypothetical protein FWF46_03930 [Oscillospiraceae bacterium]|nr:hypothetical protein [Oscillospiraceae bacterium]
MLKKIRIIPSVEKKWTILAVVVLFLSLPGYVEFQYRYQEISDKELQKREQVFHELLALKKESSVVRWYLGHLQGITQNRIKQRMGEPF